MVILFSCD